MPRNLQADVTTQITAKENRPVLLLEMGITPSYGATSGVTLYYCTANADVTFPTGGGGQVYTSKALQLGTVAQSAEGEINRITIKLDNTGQDISSYLTVGDFRNRPLIIKRVYMDALGNSLNFVEVFHGTMEAIKSMDYNWVPVTAVGGKGLGKRAFLRQYQRQCNHIFGDSKTCNTDGFADLTSPSSTYDTGAVFSGTTDSIRLRQSGATMAISTDDYFKHGLIQFGKSGTTYTRYCNNYYSATTRAQWSVQSPVTPDNTYRYVIYKGCSKSINSCTAGSAWGPTADNQLNFGGFIHIGQDYDY